MNVLITLPRDLFEHTMTFYNKASPTAALLTYFLHTNMEFLGNTWAEQEPTQDEMVSWNWDTNQEFVDNAITDFVLKPRARLLFSHWLGFSLTLVY